METNEKTFSYILMYGSDCMGTYTDLEMVCKHAKKLAKGMQKQYGENRKDYIILYSGNIIAAY